jgi:peptidoglycan/LPS O-acetylase OafA/YrhL
MDVPMIDRRIPTLDGMRAIAILIVVSAHASHLRFINGLGHMGVMIFFALSGYLITSRLLDEYRTNGRISLRDFYLRRAFRILPPAVTYLAVVGLLTALGVVICNVSAIWGALLFYVNYQDVAGMAGTAWRVGHFWSLSVEEHFYLIWPSLLIFFGVLAGWRTAAALAVTLLLWRLGDNHFHIVSAPYLHEQFYRTDLIADTLLWGCCVAFVKARSNAVVSTGVAIVSAILLALMTMGISGKIGYLLQSMHFIPAVFLWAVVSCPAAPIGRFLELAPMRFIGNLSYSLYIWQQLFLGGQGQQLPVTLGVAAAFACAYLSYRFIEQPSIALGRGVVRRFRDRKRLAAAPQENPR